MLALGLHFTTLPISYMKRAQWQTVTRTLPRMLFHTIRCAYSRLHGRGSVFWKCMCHVYVFWLRMSPVYFFTDVRLHACAYVDRYLRAFSLFLFISSLFLYAPIAYFITTFSAAPMTWHAVNPKGGTSLFMGFHLISIHHHQQHRREKWSRKELAFLNLNNASLTI